jgi:hypothetical protein
LAITTKIFFLLGNNWLPQETNNGYPTILPLFNPNTPNRGVRVKLKMVLPMKKLPLVWMILIASVCVAHAQPAVEEKSPRVLTVQKISADAPHSGYTDLIWFQNLFYCCFREASAADAGDGKIRLKMSFNGTTWKDAAVLTQTGVDLRDPKLSVTQDERLICFMTAVTYEGGKAVSRQPRVATSTDGQHWSPVEKTLKQGDCLWRGVMHPTEKCFYGTMYNKAPVAGGADEAEWALKLMKSDDGKIWQLVAPFDLKGKPNEATARPLANGDMMALVRRDAPGSIKGMLGLAKPPYREWTWTELSVPLAGPNFIQTPDGRLIAGSRGFGATPGGHMILSEMSASGLKPMLELPSSGDCSYPGMVYHEKELWVSYYSAHEGKPAIYVARVAL